MTDNQACVDPRPTRTSICDAMNAHTREIAADKMQIALSKAQIEAAKKAIVLAKTNIRGLSERILKSNIARDALLRDNFASALYFVENDKYYAIPDADATDRAWCDAEPAVRTIVKCTSIPILEQTRIHWIVRKTHNPGK